MTLVLSSSPEDVQAYQRPVNTGLEIGLNIFIRVIIIQHALMAYFKTLEVSSCAQIPK